MRKAHHAMLEYVVKLSGGSMDAMLETRMRCQSIAMLEIIPIN